jgi:hypothetical protein
MTGLGVASAATGTPSKDDTSGLADKLASKFNLDKNEVKAVFEEERAEREAEAQKNLEERLSQAVTEGKLTEDQKEKILTKIEELKAQREANREAIKKKTPAENREFKEQQVTDIEAWAEENNIPVEYLMFTRGGALHDAGNSSDRVASTDKTHME